MNCQKLRDLIMTDYIDQEASEAVRKEVQAHLKVCAGCKAFEQALREQISDPLRKMEAATPPESVWQHVRETIEEEEAARYSPSFLRRIADLLAGAFSVRKPVVAFSVSFALILFAASFLLPLYRQRAVKGYLRTQSDFMRSMSSPVNGELEKDIGFGTAIEAVFF